MTTVFQETKQCGICGSVAEYTSIGSTNAFGSADLDTRPPEMKRSTIFAWVQRCAKCGYCDADVSQSCPSTPEVVASAAYKAQLSDPSYSELANSFLCTAMIYRADGDYGTAAWALIHGAWVCDDTAKTDGAKSCRQMAAEMISLAEEHGQRAGADDRANTAILVDLLRRSNQFEQARQVLAKQQSSEGGDVIGRVLKFQKALLNKNDTSCHTIAEALAE